MGSTVTTDSESTLDDSDALSRDDTLELLSNQRRRFAIHYLKRRDRGEVTVSELTDAVAGWENDKRPAALSHRERKRVRNALRQFHLPKMDDYGFVDYDAQRGTARLTEVASNTDFYVDSLTGNATPWSVYYLGFAALSIVCLVGVWLDVGPFAALSPLTYAVCVVAALLVSALGHFYDNYFRMRMGANTRPPEVEDP
jgi:hypothetical protein